MTSRRDPEHTQAWLIGSGIASLTAAVHLICDAKVPATNIHILDLHSVSGGAIKNCGNAEDGYVLYTGCLPYFHDRCVEGLLSLVPAEKEPKISLLEHIRGDEKKESSQRQALTRLLKQGKNGPQRVDASHLQIGPRYRFELIKIMLDRESSIGVQRIDECFDEAFFKTNFWALWSTTFAMQPWHSVFEFRRSLRKHLGDIEKLNNVTALDRTKYTIYESIILPITDYLKAQGVDFRFKNRVSKLVTSAEPNSTTVTQIVMLDEENEQERVIQVDPKDLVMATLGSPNSGSRVGSHLAAPASPASQSDLLDADWSLWAELVQKSPSYGDPTHFTGKIPETTIESFTITLQNEEFMREFERCTGDKPGVGALLSFTDSNWGLSLSVPAQRVCADQPADVVILWGYGLHPEAMGNFVPKPMSNCSGREITTEVLSHLGFSLEEYLPHAKTIPVIMPLGTAPMLPRVAGNRPEVIPSQSKNLALLGQYVNIAEDTTLNMEYSVRSAQIAVYHLMGLSKHPPKPRMHLLLNVLDLLGGA